MVGRELARDSLGALQNFPPSDPWLLASLDSTIMAKGAQSRRVGEPTQMGNPNRLSRRQHLFPAESIRRFCDPTGRVLLNRKQPKKSILVTPESQEFWVDRVWAHGDEMGYMNEVEVAFQSVADCYLGRDGILQPEQSKAVTRMHCLWLMRWRYRHAPPAPVVLNGIPDDPDITPSVEEQAEALGVSMVRKGGAVAARSIHGTQILQLLDQCCRQHRHVQWCSVSFPGCSLAVPDSPVLLYLPVSPNRAFVPVEDREVSGTTINKLVGRTAEVFYFCRP